MYHHTASLACPPSRLLLCFCDSTLDLWTRSSMQSQSIINNTNNSNNQKSAKSVSLLLRCDVASVDFLATKWNHTQYLLEVRGCALQKNSGLIKPRLGSLSFSAAICTAILPCWIWYCSYAIIQYKINWISVQSEVKFICLLQVGVIYSHDDIIG